ncbi:MAG: hypothetical protein MZV64_40745 [Ignavibacteriales bacterium]|nr:hypothetical protein [Ignavibacteriales bacterium]
MLHSAAAAVTHPDGFLLISMSLIISLFLLVQDNSAKVDFTPSGGAGFVYIGFVPNLRIGGMGFGGSTSESALLNGFEREAVYQISGGGLTVEYTLPFIKNMAVSVGTIIGGAAFKLSCTEIPEILIGKIYLHKLLLIISAVNLQMIFSY